MPLNRSFIIFFIFFFFVYLDFLRDLEILSNHSKIIGNIFIPDFNILIKFFYHFLILKTSISLSLKYFFASPIIAPLHNLQS